MTSFEMPYIGIVGVKNTAEAEATANVMNLVLDNKLFSHCPQIGLQVTDRTLRGELTESRRNPVIVDIPKIFETALKIRKGVLNVVHYTTKEPDLLPESVAKILGLEDMYKNDICRGLQLNGVFGKVVPETVEKIRVLYPELKIILQIPGSALSSMPPDAIALELKKFNFLVNYVLIDPSGGRGQELDVRLGSEVARAILRETSIGVALAGGLNGGNVAKIVKELSANLRTNNFSIDAEGGLRDKVGEGYGNDDFNLRKAEAYFKNAVGAFGYLSF